MIVTRQVTDGRGKGYALRDALRFASDADASRTPLPRTPSPSPTPREDESIIYGFMEMEKVDFVNHISTCARYFVDHPEVSVVNPKRLDELFKQTYAIEQYHSESFGNAYLNFEFLKSKNISPSKHASDGVDWLFGPILFNASCVPSYLSYAGPKWDAQMVPAIERLISSPNSIIASVEIPFVHSPLQKKQEAGDVGLCAKRLEQLEYMTNTLTKAFDGIYVYPIGVVVEKKKVIGITGVNGNVGSKLARHVLRTRSDIKELRLFDLTFNEIDDVVCDARSTTHALDLRVANKELTKAFTDIDVLFVLAAKNPFPEATSLEASDSMKITTNTIACASAANVQRIVFASSNHVLGGHIDSDQTPLNVETSMAYGTKLDGVMDSSQYAAAKVCGEHMLTSLHAVGALNEVVVWRIGWCQPGENLPRTMGVSGTPTVSESALKRQKTQGISDKTIREWWRNMWLSNDDLYELTDATISASIEGGKMVYVNAVSANSGTRWELGSEVLRWNPKDDALACLNDE